MQDAFFFAVDAIAASNHWWAFSGRYRGNKAPDGIVLSFCTSAAFPDRRAVLEQWYSPQICTVLPLYARGNYDVWAGYAHDVPHALCGAPTYNYQLFACIAEIDASAVTP